MKSGTLTYFGGVTAFFIGTLTLATQPLVGMQILTFFFLGKHVTKVGAKKKALIEEEFTEKRTALQVLANGGIPTLFVILSFMVNKSDRDVSLAKCFQNRCFDQRFHHLIIGALCALSAACGDTFSSELGMLSNQQPRLITTWKKVPRGTNGGVTLYGFYAAVQGGFWMGLLTFLYLLDFSNLSLFAHIMCLSCGSALIGSIFDSYLGAWFEFSAEDKTTGKVVNSPTTNPEMNIICNPLVRISGNTVNFLSCLATSFLVPALHALI